MTINANMSFRGLFSEACLTKLWWFSASHINTRQKNACKVFFIFKQKGDSWLRNVWILPVRNCLCTETREGQTDNQTKRCNERWGHPKQKQNHLQPQRSAHEIVNMVHLLFYHSLLKWWEINTGTFLVCDRWVCHSVIFSM